jgi:hypothetical protein
VRRHATDRFRGVGSAAAFHGSLRLPTSVFLET